MIHIGDKIVAPRGIAAVRIGDLLVFDAESAGGLAVTASPALARGAQAYGDTIDVTTQFTQATASGGTAPYSYAWTDISSEGSWTIIAPLTGLAAFRAIAVDPNTGRNGTFKCTVTDARGRTGEVTITAFAQNYGDLDGSLD